eukprot:s3163_g7.t3
MKMRFPSHGCDEDNPQSKKTLDRAMGLRRLRRPPPLRRLRLLKRKRRPATNLIAASATQGTSCRSSPDDLPETMQRNIALEAVRVGNFYAEDQQEVIRYIAEVHADLLADTQWLRKNRGKLRAENGLTRRYSVPEILCKKHEVDGFDIFADPDEAVLLAERAAKDGEKTSRPELPLEEAQQIQEGLDEVVASAAGTGGPVGSDEVLELLGRAVAGGEVAAAVYLSERIEPLAVMLCFRHVCAYVIIAATTSEAQLSLGAAPASTTTPSQSECPYCIQLDGKCYFPDWGEPTWWENHHEKACRDCSLCTSENAKGWKKVDHHDYHHDWIFAMKGTGCTVKNSLGEETPDCLESVQDLQSGKYERGSSCNVLLKKKKYLTFDSFLTERSWDRLRVVDLNESEKLLHSWSGEVKPAARLFENSWTIQWKADFSVEKILCCRYRACSSFDHVNDRSQRQLPIPGWDISWIRNCSRVNNSDATFTPDEKGIQCISEREESTVYVAVMLSGAFEVSAMLVLSSTAYLLPLCLGLYLLAMVVFTVADTKSWEAKLRGFFAEFFVATNECWCRRRGAIVYASLLSVLMAFWTFCVPGSPVFLWPWGIFYLTSLAIFFYHRRMALAAEEAKQMLSCWSWQCCLCCLCCWNPLGSCLPLTTSETLEKATTRTHLQRQQEMQEIQEPLMPSTATGDADISSPLHRLLAKSKEDVDKERLQMQLFKHLVDRAQKSEGFEEASASRPGTTMLWLAKWTVQQPGPNIGSSKKLHAACAELLPVLYSFLWSLVVARICLEHQDGFIQMPLPSAFGNFAPILEKYEFDLGILPTCLAVHFACIALSSLIESRASAQRLREWLYTYGPLEQWKEMYPKAHEMSDVTYTLQGQGDDPAQAPKSDDTAEDICGFKVFRQDAALPSSREVTLKVAATAGTLLSLSGTLFYFRYISYGLQEASGDWQMKRTFAVTYPVMFYFLLWLPLIWHRLLNGLLFAGECSLLKRTASVFFEDVSAGKETRGDVKALLETLGWKVQDILSDWRLLVKVGFVLDGFALVTGGMASYRLVIHYEVHQFVPVLACNCLTILSLLCLQVVPMVNWNAFLEEAAGNEQNTDPVLYMWLSQGYLKMQVFGLTLSPAYFLGLVLSLAALAEPYISDVAFHDGKLTQELADKLFQILKPLLRPSAAAVNPRLAGPWLKSPSGRFGAANPRKGLGRLLDRLAVARKDAKTEAKVAEASEVMQRFCSTLRPLLAASEEVARCRRRGRLASLVAAVCEQNGLQISSALSQAALQHFEGAGLLQSQGRDVSLQAADGNGEDQDPAGNVPLKSLYTDVPLLEVLAKKRMDRRRQRQQAREASKRRKRQRTE